MRQHAPRGITIVVAAILVLIGILGTFFGVIPRVAGIDGQTIGALAYVSATLLMLGGAFFRGL